MAALVAAGIFSVSTLTGQAFTPQSWQFGSDEGRDGDGGFPLLAVASSAEGNVAQWSLTADAIRLTASDVYNDFSALLPITGLGGTSLQNFTITLEGTMVTIPGDSWAFRGGAVALGGGDLGSVYGTTDSYVASLHRIQTSTERRLRIATGPGGSALANVTPDSLSSGDAFTVRLAGTFDNGALTMVASTWYNNDMGTIWTAGPVTVQEPLDGNYFGIGGRARAGLEVDFHSLAIVPEPSTYALIGGVAVLGLVFVRRRFGR